MTCWITTFTVYSLVGQEPCAPDMAGLRRAGPSSNPPLSAGLKTDLPYYYKHTGTGPSLNM